MLYKKNCCESLDKNLFASPTCEYRGAPFWAWNCKVTKEDTDLILQVLKEMGMGGAHIHCRTGMSWPYLSQEFMDAVQYAHEASNRLKMSTWLYDEDRFPSGFAGGKVTKNPEYRQRYLVLSPIALPCESKGEKSTQSRKFIGRYAIRLKNGCLSKYLFLGTGKTASRGFETWYLYRDIAQDNAWFNNQAYVDTLNPKAINQFLKITHEAYYRALGDAFGKTIPAIFTDEPQFRHKDTLAYAQEKKCIFLPFTDDLPDTYQAAYHRSFLETLPECIWELPNGTVSENRYYYHDHICERFTQAFADNIGAWCQAHGIALTGHMMEEPTLASQTAVLGEAMRSYRAFELPGIDMLYDSRELNTAKQAQSAVHQYGREGMLSELYGVTNWDFDFRGHKLAGDWQSALGVTIRVHHLTWTSMAGEAKRDYPASIGYQSPWYHEYHYIEDYFARLNTALTRGKPEVKVAVLHPIESYWLYWGTSEQTKGLRDEMEQQFQQLTEWLLFGLIDFDFISQALWETQTPDSDLLQEQYLRVGAMKYDVILVPSCVTLRKSVLARLRAFQANGGHVIFAGEVPTHIDAIPSEEAALFSQKCQKVSFAKSQILHALEPCRTLDIHTQSGMRTDNIIYQMRNDRTGRWLFLAHCNKMANPDLPQVETLSIKIAGIYRPLLYNALTGDVTEVPFQCKDGYTLLSVQVYEHDSLLYFLDAADKSSCKVQLPKQSQAKRSPVSYPDFVHFVLEEPNVLVLDIAESKLDDSPWQAAEEILLIDNQYRQIAGYPMRTEAFPQPWIYTEKSPVLHKLVLKFKIQSACAVHAPVLALENAQETKISLNGAPVASIVTGYYVDRAIQTVALPDLAAGENILLAEMPYHHDFNVEAMYLLGNFGVRTAGRHTVLLESAKKLAFGDITVQGLPFYGGNLTYKILVTAPAEGRFTIQAAQFRCPLVKVAVDGAPCGIIAFSPYSVTTGVLCAGPHLLELTAYGNRINTFGALHNCNHTVAWPGHPNSFRTTGDEWAYEYQLKPTGILTSPVITFENGSLPF